MNNNKIREIRVIRENPRFRRYPEYKESSVEWIGKIPVHWKVKRLKYVADLSMGQSPPSEEYNSDKLGYAFTSRQCRVWDASSNTENLLPNSKEIRDSR